jgi:hypothetical protein
VGNIEILPFQEAPEGQVFNLSEGEAENIGKTLDALNMSIKYDYTLIENKSNELIAFELASVELGLAQTDADNLSDNINLLTLQAAKTADFVIEKQAAFDEAKTALDKATELAIEEKEVAVKVATKTPPKAKAKAKESTKAPTAKKEGNE